MTMAPSVRLEVWSDYVCPFCFLEEPVLARLQREMGEELEVRWRAYELRPEPVPTLDPRGEYLRTTWERAVYPMAERRGMTLRLPPVQPRSRKALEAAEFAREAGLFTPFHRALFGAFFHEGRDIGDTAVLLDIGASTGLDRDALARALEEGRYTAHVERDRAEAERLGIRGVPAMRVVPLQRGRPLLVSGAQPEEVVRAAIEQVRSEAAALPAP